MLYFLVSLLSVVSAAGIAIITGGGKLPPGPLKRKVCCFADQQKDEITELRNTCTQVLDMNKPFQTGCFKECSQPTRVIKAGFFWRPNKENPVACAYRPCRFITKAEIEDNNECDLV
jgi:hypothetical protein